MSEGVPVFGAASMGALRAAELHEFGMRGIGRIFEAFRDGVARRRRRGGGRPWAGRDRLSSRVGSDGQHPRDARARRSERRHRHRIAPRARRLREGAVLRRPQLAGAARRRGPSRRRANPSWLRSAIGCRRDASIRSGWTGSRCSPRCRRRPAAGEPASPAYHFEWTYFWDAFVARSEMSAFRALGKR